MACPPYTTSRHATLAQSARGRIHIACSLPILFVLVASVSEGTNLCCGESKEKEAEGGREGQTRQLFVLVLVVFVAVSVRCDVGASFCVSNELHLVGVFFYAYLAEIPQSAQDCRHFVKCVRGLG